jgi:hypothetical protein
VALGALVLGAGSCDARDASDEAGTGGSAPSVTTGGTQSAAGGNTAAAGASAGSPARGGSPVAGGASGASGGALEGGATSEGGAGADAGGATGELGGAPNGGTPAAAGAAGSGGTPSGGAAPPGCEESAVDRADFETVLEVGPGRDLATPSDVPWESLEPGTLVLVHARSEPYRDKWVLNSRGTEEAPIVVRGVPDGSRLPVISGDGATTREELDFWNEERGLIKIGGANVPDDGAEYVSVECLDIHTARPGSSFTDTGGSSAEYAQNAACVYIEDGSHVSVRNNLIHACGNGIFASSGASDVLISGNHVYDNGNEGSIYEHNSYTEAAGITFEFNHYGPLCEGCEGNNLKDRSAGLVVRYNWIEHGNRQLDLVETSHEELRSRGEYATTFVYGNVLVEPDGAGNAARARSTSTTTRWSRRARATRRSSACPATTKTPTCETTCST